MKTYPICIYTMKSMKDLESAFNKAEITEFIENKIWRSGFRYFQKSIINRERMLIFFSNSEETSGIIFIGEILDIFLNEDECKTIYKFKMLYKLDNPKPLSKLVLLSSNKHMSDNYIRPYAVILLPEDLDDWISEKGIKAITITKKTGQEQFKFRQMEIPMKLEDFWKWAYSNLIGNTCRGILAEYIVAMALGIDKSIQENWKPYDLDYASLKIEVKSSAYIQSWKQQKNSDIRFSIRKTTEDNTIADSQIKIATRKADIYIFCLLEHKIQESLNPMDLTQWRFYILQTKLIDIELKEAKSISLKKLKELKVKSCYFDRLKDIVDSFVT